MGARPARGARVGARPARGAGGMTVCGVSPEAAIADNKVVLTGVLGGDESVRSTRMATR
jgi:hypothetical protein